MAPDGWALLHLVDLCLPKNGIRRGPFGGALKKSSFVPSGYKVYEQSNVIYDDFNSGSYYIDDNKFRGLKAFEIFPNDLLISCSGTVGKVVVVPVGVQPGVMNQALLRLRPDLTKVLTRYLWIVLNSEDAQKKLTGATHGSAMKNIVGVGQLKKINFLIPPIDIQQVIVSVLSSWMDSISKVERLINAKVSLKKSLMQRLLTGKVRFKGFGEAALGGKLPADWKKLPLKSCADVRFSNVDKKTDKADRAVKLCNYMDVYANENITDEISFMNASATAREIERFALHRGDVVITKDSEAPDDIGIPTYIAQEIPDLVCGYHLALCRPKKGVASGRWLAKWFQLPQVKKYFISTANGVTRFGLATKDLYELPLWCPSVAEQEKIADVIELVDREILLLKKRLSELKQQKTGLMQKLLTGEIPVKV